MAQSNQRLSPKYPVILVFRDEITCEDGILYKGTKLIIPKTERASTLKVLHMGHYAIDKMSLGLGRQSTGQVSAKTSGTHITTVISVQSLQELNKETFQFTETPQTA